MSGGLFIGTKQLTSDYTTEEIGTLSPPASISYS